MCPFKANLTCRSFPVVCHDEALSLLTLLFENLRDNDPFTDKQSRVVRIERRRERTERENNKINLNRGKKAGRNAVFRIRI